MARRKKSETNGQATEAVAGIGTMEVPPEVIAGLDAMAEEFGGGPPRPSIEDRLAALEAQLTESQALVNSQARVIVQAAENAEQLKNSRARVAKLEARMDAAKKAAAEAKKAYEAAVEEHFSLEDELSSGQTRLPFPAEPEAKPEALPAPEAATEPEAAPAADDESWRSLDIGGLNLKAAVQDKLRSAGIDTIGGLSDYLKPNAAGFVKRLTDLPGIGQAKAEAIEEALMGFWASRAMDADGPVLDVEATLQAGCEAVEVRRAEEYAESLAGVHADPSGNGEWEDSEPASEAYPDDDDEDSSDLGI